MLGCVRFQLRIHSCQRFLVLESNSDFERSNPTKSGVILPSLPEAIIALIRFLQHACEKSA
ncbi:MAG: hypothetical protein CMI66_01870 [Pedosphaera sp.]|nr:hypothetical protein [Pedosphaera sp.]HBP54953.1 hypothetical protein [Verrucomicrobiales bacterium]HCP36361.1 hypothetical protein [Verrucomicrobiales bacterium]HCZ02216.1 hypothetical protein [Verrucomicrobiales bacterium]